MSITTHDHIGDRHWTQTRLHMRGTSNRWTIGEENFYIDRAVIIGDLTEGIRKGVREIHEIGALPIAPFEFGDLVQVQNPDIIVEYPWLQEGVITNDATYPFTVQRRVEEIG